MYVKVADGANVTNMDMINTSECEKCKYGILDETNKAKIIVHCEAKGKEYIYGQCIPCEYKVTK